METLQEFQPRLVYNNYKERIKVSHELELLFKNCDSFELSVAFIADSGLAALKECFDYLRNHHIPFQDLQEVPWFLHTAQVLLLDHQLKFVLNNI